MFGILIGVIDTNGNISDIHGYNKSFLYISDLCSCFEGLAFMADKMGPMLVEISLTIFGVTGGPLLGLFVMALFFPCINSLVCQLLSCNSLREHTEIKFWQSVFTIHPRALLKYMQIQIQSVQNVQF